MTSGERKKAEVRADLGKLVREYGRSPAQVRRVLWISLGSACVGALVFWAAFSGGQPVGHTIGLSILGAFLSLPAVFGVRELARNRGTSVGLHENGIVVRKSGRTFIATWNDVASFTEHAAVRVERKDGEVVEFGAAVEGYEEIGARIEEETLKRHLPEVVAAIRAGSTCVFRGLSAGSGLLGAAVDRALLCPDGFSVDAAGISNVATGDRIAWSDVQASGVAEGQEKPWAGFFFFFVEGKAKTLRVLYGGLPNAHVLVAVCAELSPGAKR